MRNWKGANSGKRIGYWIRKSVFEVAVMLIRLKLALDCFSLDSDYRPPTLTSNPFRSEAISTYDSRLRNGRY
jgi:hypothetical protein